MVEELKAAHRANPDEVRLVVVDLIPDVEALVPSAARIALRRTPVSGNPRAPRAVVGGIQRDETIIRLGEAEHLDEIAAIFIHHPAELDGCLPSKPLRNLAGYVVAVDTMAERTDTNPGGPRRQPARLVCIGGHGHSPVGWARFIDEPDEWHLMHDLGELEEFTAEMLSELRWYQMRVNNR